MAEQKGIDGIVKVKNATDSSLVTMLNVTSFNIEETTETIDVTAMGDGNRKVLPTFTGFSGSIDGYYDDGATQPFETDTDGTDPDVVAGNTIDFEIYPSGVGSGERYYSGQGIVTSVNRTASFDGAVEFSIAFEGTGNLTFEKVA